ncbi:zinc finger BED domain-containing protein RICESLEEPER 2-like [Senna tora]|uniref:Zinc finger BED domain-containing protein RICESLEEPER 2-like n=1 Tax=Senna tora TaxID=362788 RepID=A0A835CLC9_9FABA|nr:zinc finger BED domain-containing protein RICESLEEPER 2-like [Senna tora]
MVKYKKEQKESTFQSQRKGSVKRKSQFKETRSLIIDLFDHLHGEALARMIIVDELPFKHIEGEGEGFRYFMSIVQPMFPIPSRITIARDCLSLYVKEKARLKETLLKGYQSVCLTTDCWTSVQNMNYLVLTTHFIDIDWKLHKRILNFCPMENHRGETIGEAIESCLIEWGIEKVFTITVHNASLNDVVVSYLRGKINGWNGSVLRGDYLHVRCVAHILNLVVNDRLKSMHESITKIRNEVRYVHAFPARMKKFKECIEKEKIQSTSMFQLDVPTRWNSTYLMLDSALKFEKAFSRYESQYAHYVLEHLEEGKRRGIPAKEDWENARIFVKFLKVFYDVTNAVSGTLFVTSSNYFHDFCLVVKTLKG